MGQAQKVLSELEERDNAIYRVYFEANPIETIVKDLQVKGVKFCGEIEVYSYGKLILFSDLDNNSLGLYEPPKKSPENDHKLGFQDSF